MDVQKNSQAAATVAGRLVSLLENAHGVPLGAESPLKAPTLRRSWRDALKRAPTCFTQLKPCPDEHRSCHTGFEAIESRNLMSELKLRPPKESELYPSFCCARHY
jgi:hypothetical protein